MPVHGNTHDSSLPHKAGSSHSARSSQVNLVFPTASTYSFERYIYRSTLNTLGPCLLTAFYLFIVCVYLLRPEVNGVIPYFPIDARGVFFAWLILSIFFLDWAKSGLAGFEASGLMKPALAPITALQLMWHADRGWGSISGWWKALSALFDYRYHRLVNRSSNCAYKGPAGLWWYLALSSFIFYAAIPLSGLSMDPKDGFHIGDRKILIYGPNQTTFDIRSSNGVAEVASSRWRQGNPTTPPGETVLYAPRGTDNVSSTFYDDAIRERYRNDLDQKISVDSPISFFSGPQVSERAHGKAWGLLTNLSCSVVHPYHDLELLNVKEIDNWTIPLWFTSSTAYDEAGNNTFQAQFSAGLNPALFYDGDESFGVNYKYLIASNSQIEGGSDYTNSTTLPLSGSLELVMWQAYAARSTPDSTFKDLSTHPLVVASIWPFDKLTYLGYAIRCSVNSTVGFADIDAKTRTYSNFAPTAADDGAEQGLDGSALAQAPGILAIQSLVYGSFTGAVLKFGAAPVCQPGGSTTCNPWYGANVATGGVPSLVPLSGKAKSLQYPTISPERMTLATHRLFGEAAIAMTASGPGTWTGGLYGVDPANDLVPGRVPWQVVVILLSVWTFITVLPNCWTFMDRRWAAILDGFEMFRLGAEWRHPIWKLDDRESTECDALNAVPGMVGDMEPGSARGFVGLSASVARAGGRTYVHDREVFGST